MSTSVSESYPSETTDTVFESASDASPYTALFDHSESVDESIAQATSIATTMLESESVSKDLLNFDELILQNVRQVHPIDPLRDFDLMRKFYIGHCNANTAEGKLEENAAFRLYKKTRSRPDLEDSSQLTMVHKNHRGDYFHYPILEANVDGIEKLHVGHGGHVTEFFESISGMIDFYSRNYVLGKGYVDVFPDPSLDGESE